MTMRPASFANLVIKNFLTILPVHPKSDYLVTAARSCSTGYPCLWLNVFVSFTISRWFGYKFHSAPLAHILRFFIPACCITRLTVCTSLKQNPKESPARTFLKNSHIKRPWRMPRSRDSAWLGTRKITHNATTTANLSEILLLVHLISLIFGFLSLTSEHEQSYFNFMAQFVSFLIGFRSSLAA